MISVEVKYKPRFLPFSIRKKVQIPSNWDECTHRQVLALLYSQTPAATDTHFISQFTGLSPWLVSKLDSFLHYQLIETITAIAKTPFSGMFYIKTVRCGRQILHAPADRMHGVTFGQFIFVDAFFNDREPESISKFITHLYLPKGETFDENSCIARAAKLNIDPQTAEAILYNYGMFYDYFQRAYPLLFTTPNPDTKKAESIGIKYDPRGWLKVYESVVGSDIINAERYANVPLNTMFKFLTDQIKKQATN